MSVVDLFCGCGGLSLGAAMAGLPNTVAIDRDAALASAHLANFPNCRLMIEDVAAVTPAQILALIPDSERPTAVIGGPPCQGFSSIGRRRIDDPRNELLRLYFEMVSALRPKFFLMENVPGLLDRQNRPALDRAMEAVGPAYRILEPMILNAADYGAATSRPRLVVVGYDPTSVDAVDISDFREAASLPRPTVAEAFDGLPSPTAGGWATVMGPAAENGYAAARRNLPPPGVSDPTHLERFRRGLVSGFEPTIHSQEVITRFREVPPGGKEAVSRYVRLAWDRPAHVLRAGTGSDRGSFQAPRPIHPTQPRVITVREAARLQGFPDWFAFHATKWHSHRMIGNSVSPPFAAALLSVLAAKCGAGSGSGYPLDSAA